jgi:O-antigen/teichoic acid export membrane protein
MGPWVIAQKLLRQGEKNLRPFIIQSVLGREAVAIWSFVEKVYTYVASVFPIDDVLMPMVAGDRSDRMRLREILYRGIRYTVPFYAAMSVFVALTAKPIVQIAFPQYLEAVPSVYVICAYNPFIGVAYILTSYYVSHQEQRRAFWLVAFRLCLMAILLPISSAFFGPMGVAIEFIVSVSIYNILRLRTLLVTFPELQTASKKILTIDEVDRDFFKRLRYFFRKK